MKIILDNFNYKGKHFDRYECDLPQVTNVDELPEDKIIEYIIENLEEFIKEGES